MKVKAKECYEVLKYKEEIGRIYTDVKTNYKIAKIMKTIEEEMKVLAEEEKKIFEQYVDRDEQGDPIPAESGSGWKCEKQDEFREKVEELMEIDMDLPLKKLTLEELERVSLSNAALTAMLFLIEEE